MADREVELPPMMQERLVKVGKFTAEEKDRMKKLDNLDSLLKEFYKGYLDARDLWERLKEFERQGNPFLLRDADIKLKSSFKWKGLPIEFVEAEDGAISVEFRDKK